MDQENATPDTSPQKKRRSKAAKPNGKEKAKGAGNGSAAAAATSKPGEQGTATQEQEESKAPAIWKRKSTAKERDRAGALVLKLQNEAHDMGAEAVIDALIAVVDTVPEFTVPHQWPGEGSEEYRQSPVIERIGLLLCRGCPKIDISGRRVTFLWRNTKNWTKQGAAVHAAGKSYGALLTHHSGGFMGAVIANYQILRLLNPRQKVRAIYKALRCLDENGTVIPNHFEGFYDELELFGTGTSPEDHRLARAVELASQRELPFPDVFEVEGH